MRDIVQIVLFSLLAVVVTGISMSILLWMMENLETLPAVLLIAWSILGAIAWIAVHENRQGFGASVTKEIIFMFLCGPIMFGIGVLMPLAWCVMKGVDKIRGWLDG